MKKILYILLYSPYLNWQVLIKWFNEILLLNSESHQFLLYFKKVWIQNPKIWHVGEKPQEAVLTNCALESYHKRLNSELKTNPSIESFSHDLYNFDMKNLRELHKRRDEVTKYQKFLRKKDEIIQLMNTILNDCKSRNPHGENNLNGDVQFADPDSESWSRYNENNNELFSDFLFGESFGSNSEIIDNQISHILENFQTD